MYKDWYNFMGDFICPLNICADGHSLRACSAETVAANTQVPRWQIQLGIKRFISEGKIQGWHWVVRNPESKDAQYVAFHGLYH